MVVACRDVPDVFLAGMVGVPFVGEMVGEMQSDRPDRGALAHGGALGCVCK